MRILFNVGRGTIDQIDYSKAYETFQENAGNVGNKIYIHSIYSMLNIPQNEIEFVELDNNLRITNYTFDYINNNFDVFIFPSIIFGSETALINTTKVYTEIVNQLKIPAICFSVGIQESSYDRLNNLFEETKDVVKPFVKRVLELNGTLMLRGFITEDYFKRMGFSNLPVTGCPSLYQAGKDLFITKKTESDFIASLNGNTVFLRTKFARYNIEKYSNIEYIDQDQFVKLLYGQNINDDFISMLKLIKGYGYTSIKMLGDSRIHLMCNFDEWIGYFQEKKITFSIGGRIHGNIIALLAKVPAFVCYHDARTREMAEFFNIPCADINSLKQKDIKEIYDEISFDKFNSSINEKIDYFSKTLNDLSLPHIIDNYIGNETLMCESGKYENEFNKQRCKKLKLLEKVAGKILFI